MTTYTTTVYAAGTAAAGTAPAGLSEEVVTEQNETQFGARYLDPRTKDYAVKDGEIQRASNSRQRVILILTTEVRTSLAIKGIDFPDQHTDSTARVAEADVRRHLQPLLDDASISNIRVTVATRADDVIGRLGIGVEYFDNETGETEAVQL